MVDIHKNLAQSLLASVPADRTSGTNFTVAPGDGFLFAPNMPVTLAPYGEYPSYDNAEIARVISVTGDAVVLERGTEGSIPKIVQVGWVIAGTVTAGTLEAIEDAVLTKADQTYVDELIDGLDLTGAVKSVAGRTGIVTLSKADVGLNSVDNTSDAAKPVSAATQTALNAKYNSSNPAGYVDAFQAAASAPVQSVAGKQGAVTLAKGDVGLGNVDNTSDASKPVSTATSSALALKAPLASPAFTGTPTGITKAHVGLGNVDNTSDATKPVSTATQTALDTKVQLGGDIGGPVTAPTVKKRAVTKTVGSSNADYLFGSFVSARAAINQAISDVSSAGGGVVQLFEESIAITGQITAKSNVLLNGMGQGVTILNGGVGSGYTITSPNSTTITNFGFSNLTIDCQNVPSASGVRLNKSFACYGQNVTIRNVASGGWGMVIGSTETTNTIECSGNKYTDFTFLNHAGSLEILLIFQARDTEIIRPYFTGKSTVGPIVGIYQSTENTRFVDAKFVDNAGYCVYYSLTCNNTYFFNPYFRNSGSGFQGANQSDNDGGTFGVTQVRGLFIHNAVFDGGVNSVTSIAIQLGAVDHAVVTNPKIEGYDLGIKIDQGNSGAYQSASTNWIIENPVIRNNNASGSSAYLLHPAILFSGIGGDLYGKIIGGAIYDTRGTILQRNPISFTGAFAWDYIEIIGSRLTADTANGAFSINVGSGASIGNNVNIYDNVSFSGNGSPTNPDQNMKLINSGIQIDAGGATKQLRFGDSWRMRGNNGHGNISAVAAAATLRFQDSSQTTKSQIDFANGFMSFGQGATSPTAPVDLLGSSLTSASLRIRTGVAPTTPNDGDVWQDGTNLYARINGVTVRVNQQLASPAFTGVPTAPTAAITDSSTQLATTAFVQSLAKTRFTQTATVTVANTVTASTLVGAGKGSATIAANSLAVGDTVRFRFSGVYSLPAGATPPNVEIVLGTTVLVNGSAAANMFAAAVTNGAFDIQGGITFRTIGSTGTAVLVGSAQYSQTAGGSRSPVDLTPTSTTPITINTTLAQALAARITWSTASASRTISATYGTIEVI